MSIVKATSNKDEIIYSYVKLAELQIRIQGTFCILEIHDIGCFEVWMFFILCSKMSWYQGKRGFRSLGLVWLGWLESVVELDM